MLKGWGDLPVAPSAFPYCPRSEIRSAIVSSRGMLSALKSTGPTFDALRRCRDGYIR